MGVTLTAEIDRGSRRRAKQQTGRKKGYEPSSVFSLRIPPAACRCAAPLLGLGTSPSPPRAPSCGVANMQTSMDEVLRKSALGLTHIAGR